MDAILMTRQEANLEVLKDLTILANHFPMLRFHQLLMVVGMIETGEDKFYEESVDTLKQLEENENFKRVLDELLK